MFKIILILFLITITTFGCDNKKQIKKVKKVLKNDKFMVTIDKKDGSKFKVDISEVTVGNYQNCVDQKKCDDNMVIKYDKGHKLYSKCNYKKGKKDYPINCIPYKNSAQYCSWKGKRLPTKEEYIVVAKGGKNSKYYWGDDIKDGKKYENFGSDGVKKVKKFKISPNGVFDILGNLREWVSDKKIERGTNFHQVSGGAWYTKGEKISPYLISISDERGGFDIGFRCVKDVE